MGIAACPVMNGNAPFFFAVRPRDVRSARTSVLKNLGLTRTKMQKSALSSVVPVLGFIQDGRPSSIGSSLAPALYLKRCLHIPQGIARRILSPFRSACIHRNAPHKARQPSMQGAFPLIPASAQCRSRIQPRKGREYLDQTVSSYQTCPGKLKLNRACVLAYGDR